MEKFGWGASGFEPVWPVRQPNIRKPELILHRHIKISHSFFKLHDRLVWVFLRFVTNDLNMLPITSKPEFFKIIVSGVVDNLSGRCCSHINI